MMEYLSRDALWMAVTVRESFGQHTVGSKTAAFCVIQRHRKYDGGRNKRKGGREGGETAFFKSLLVTLAGKHAWHFLAFGGSSNLTLDGTMCPTSVGVVAKEPGAFHRSWDCSLFYHGVEMHWGLALGLGSRSPALSSLLSWSSAHLSHTVASSSSQLVSATVCPSVLASVSHSFSVSLCLFISLLPLSPSCSWPHPTVALSVSVPSLSSLRLSYGQWTLSLPSPEIFIPSFQVPGDWKLQPHPSA